MYTDFTTLVIVQAEPFANYPYIIANRVHNVVFLLCVPLAILAKVAKRLTSSLWSLCAGEGDDSSAELACHS